MGDLFERLESFIKEDTQFGGKLVVKRERKKTNKSNVVERKRKSDKGDVVDRKRKSDKGDVMDTKLLERFHKYENKELYLVLLKNTVEKIYEPFITIDDIPLPLIPYKPGSDLPSFGEHIGQRKLFLSEMQFLIECYNKLEDKKETLYVCYAGSAPTNKGLLLSSLFPNVKFILVDPNIFELLDMETSISHRIKNQDSIIHIYYNINNGIMKSDVYKSNKVIFDYDKKEKEDLLKFIEESKKKIFIIEDFMNNELAEMFSKLPNIYFISDIRSNMTNTTEGSEDYPLDVDIIWNSSMCYNWINLLKPRLTQLKFRTPFKNEYEKNIKVLNKVLNENKVIKNDFEMSKSFGIDFVEDYKKDNIFNMSKGTVYLQTWCGSSSSETRLVIEQKDINNIKNYPIDEYENKFFTYNKIYRRLCYHKNKNSNKKLKFCNCNDCSIENRIYEDYKRYIDKKSNIFNVFNILNKVTHRSLNKAHNFTLFEVLSYKDLFKKIEEYYINRPEIKKPKHKKQIGNQGTNTKGGDRDIKIDEVKLIEPIIFTQKKDDNILHGGNEFEDVENSEDNLEVVELSVDEYHNLFNL